MMYDIIRVTDGVSKSAYTGHVLGRLPDWFGNEQGLGEYVREVAEFPYWAAFEKNGRCIGFFSIKIQYGHTGEIYVCGVLPEYQHMGIGKALYRRGEEYLLREGCSYVVVKTLSDAVEFEPYARTRRFYHSVGFEPLLTLTEMWDAENPCLIMLKTL